MNRFSVCAPDVSGTKEYAGNPIRLKEATRRLLSTVQSILERLTDPQILRGREAIVTEPEVSLLSRLAANLFLKEPTCLNLKLDQPIYVVGDLFGRHTQLLQIFAKLGSPAEKRYLFLGNYVDRGDRSIDLISILFAYKIIYPKNIYMIRGNHDCRFVSTYYGFLGECKKRHYLKAWQVTVHAFDCLPAAAILNDCIFLTHSGIIADIPTNTVITKDDLREFIQFNAPRPMSTVKNTILSELTWSEPEVDGVHWRRNPVGRGFLFPEQSVIDFCERFGFQLVVRSHDLVPDGYDFTAENKLLTIFSAASFSRQFSNYGSIARFSKRAQDGAVIGRLFTTNQVAMIRRGRPAIMNLIIRDRYAEVHGDSGDSSIEETSSTSNSGLDETCELLSLDASFDMNAIGLFYVDRQSASSVSTRSLAMPQLPALNQMDDNL